MRYLIGLILSLSTAMACAQVGSTATTCIWSGTLADCLPEDGILLRNQRDARFGEATGGGTNYVALQAPAALAGDITLTLPPDDGDANEFLQTNGSGVMTWEPIDVTTDITGVLPIVNGGTNSNAALNNNRVMRSTSGAVVESAAITAARALISDANGIPTHSSVSSTQLGYLLGATGTTGAGDLVMATSPALITPTLGAASATSVNFGQTSLNYYEEWSGTVTLTGGYSANPTGTMHITRVGRMVFAYTPSITGTSNATTNPEFAFSNTGNNIPTKFAPTATTQVVSGAITVTDNTAAAGNSSYLVTTGALRLFKNLNGGSNSFTASGGKGAYEANYVWMIR